MIRLQRIGRKHEPVFRLVLTDSKNGPKSGKFLEILGNYDTRRKEKAEFKVERVKYWLANGAKLSNTVHNFFVERKIIEGKKINALPKKSPIIKEVKANSAESPVEPEEEKKEASLTSKVEIQPENITKTAEAEAVPVTEIEAQPESVAKEKAL